MTPAIFRWKIGRDRTRKFDGFAKFMMSVPIVVAGAFIASEVGSQAPDLSIFRAEKDRPAPTDRGYRSNVRLARVVGGLGQIPAGGGPGGLFGPVLPWPIIPIHMTLLPDGRVLTYGTDRNGNQGSQFVYDIWDPKLGVGAAAHKILANTTRTDIFCGAATLFGAGVNGSTSLTGKLLSFGGDLTVNGVRNWANNNLVTLDPATDALASAGTMRFNRWYASITTLKNGDKLILGGAERPGSYAYTPELFSPTNGWQSISKIVLPSIGSNHEWYYPRSLMARDGLVYMLQHGGKIYRFVPASNATLGDTGVTMAQGYYTYPSILMPSLPDARPYKVMSLRQDKKTQIVDLYNYPPVVTTVGNTNYDREWGNLTLLADGQILLTGGSSADNEMTDVAYASEIFDRATGTWKLGASASVPRLYHSATLLLPDGSVLTGGGGAPGPLNNLNVEIYYPSYLYAEDGSGKPATRPTITSAPTTLKTGQLFDIKVGLNDKIGAVNLVRLGSKTHSWDSETRVVNIPFSQYQYLVTGFVHYDPILIPPGYYMLFVFDTKGHPSIAKIVSIPAIVQ